LQKLNEKRIYSPMPHSDIVIKGAREHNLRNIDLVLPRNQLICLTGVSGSGKSSLAFDTLYAEGQRRYIESLSTFARHFLGQMPKPDVELISGLSPSISISQKSTGKNPRSTVGTITEIYDYLRVLLARVGQGNCPECKLPITAQTRDEIIAHIMRIEAGEKYAVLAPVVRSQKGQHRDLFEDLVKQGFVRVRVNGEIYSLTDPPDLDRQKRHDIEVVIDRLTARSSIRPRLAEAVDLALQIGDGSLIVALQESADSPDPPADKATKTATRKKAGQALQNDRIFSVHYACVHCGISFQPPSPQLFSFNSPQGMCMECDGLGIMYSFDPDLLVPDPAKNFRQGCIEPLGKWSDQGRWRRHIYQGVADTMERVLDLEPGTMLETAWEQLPQKVRNVWLMGSGEQHITFTWRGGDSPMKYGGTFEGVIADLKGRYMNATSTAHRSNFEQYMNQIRCPLCAGERLNPQARFITLTTSNPEFSDSPTRTLPQITKLSIADAAEFFTGLQLDDTRQLIATEAIKEIRNRLGFLLNVGLEYLNLDRSAPTLSGGESQRIRLASQIGSGLVGVTYILDEPSIGLHARDNERLISTLQHLRDQGNTVVVVEHDEDTMRAADHLIDFGPGPGVRGGEVVAEGSIGKIEKNRKSVTGQFLSGKRSIEISKQERSFNPERTLKVVGAAHNNLKNIDVEIPLGCFVCVTGVSGSGKSSLVNDILVESLREELNRGDGEPGKHESIEGLDKLDKLIAIDQSPIGRTPRSNPGTYIKLFDEIRNLYAQLPESKKRGFKPGRFSFNVKEGRCAACEGNGANKLEMDFLADVWVTCPVCEGSRFGRETLQVKFKDKTIADVLEMDVQEAIEFFENQPKILGKLKTLHDVGLDYVKIGQPSPTLSGGEAQRIKLARELSKKSTGKTLYLLDEPTTGLHFADIHMLLNVLHDFVDAGNTVLVVEHNIDVIKTADWIIDLGPEGGAGGGEIVIAGTPLQVADCERSETGKILKAQSQPRSTRKHIQSARKSGQVKPATEITVQGARQHNLKSVDARIPRDKMTVFCGPSGSGKSSLAMDTIYAEGQRRYVESLSSYARQFVNQMQKPLVDHVEGLSPAIAIEQRALGHSPRSTVGTVTEVYDYLRILMARLGTPYCPQCDIPIGTQTSDQIVDKIMREPEGTRLFLMAPLYLDLNTDPDSLIEDMRANGYIRLRVDGHTFEIEDLPVIDRRKKQRLEVIVDRIVVKTGSQSRIAESVEAALSIGKGIMHVAYPSEEPEVTWRTMQHSQHLACESCGKSYQRLTPHHFSFNSAVGWCRDCEGLGTQRGANPEAVIRNPALSLAEGALEMWPGTGVEISKWMLKALEKTTGIPIDRPYDQLGARHRKVLFFGFKDRWLEAKDDDGNKLFSFQFKGIYPALSEASRLSPRLRSHLISLVDTVECGSCGGSRLRDDAAAVRFKNLTVDELCRKPIGELSTTVSKWKFDKNQKKIAGEIIREIKNRVQFLNDVGLEYLTLARGAATLSGGESQRIRLASQLGSGLCGVLYVLDEPTIGLHPRDNLRLISALHRLRDIGNTLLVVEHDKDVINSADMVSDFGPKAGDGGGKIVAQAAPAELPNKRGSVTGPYLNGARSIPIPKERRPVLIDENGTKKKSARQNVLEIVGARHNNLKNINVKIPLGTLTVVTGPSGCGKSSLINDILYKTLARKLHRANLIAGAHDKILGLPFINKVIQVDQSPLGNSPSSNPATYTGAFDLIRTLYASLPDSKVRGFSARRFSFNAPGGRCEACEGNGQKRIEMHFLPDIWVKCETCDGQRYNPETLAVKYHGYSINDVLEMPIGQAVKLFENIPKIDRILQTLCDVGLDYVNLGQAAPTLSGGEAQRVKLAAELARPDTGQTLYLLDEPTTGLHFDDLAKLLDVLHRLVDIGNTVVLIEHNLDIIKAADWVIDMGPEAGADGGQVVIAGTPESIVEYAQKTESNGKPRNKHLPSYTGIALANVLAQAKRIDRKAIDESKRKRRKTEQLEIEDVGKNVKMPWEADGRKWHLKDRVDRKGQPVKWDGEMLDRVVDYIEQKGDFSDTVWNERTVVEIAGKNKSRGWFFHAITAETWLLKMKFRVKRGVFKRDELPGRLDLKTLNQIDEVPLYGNQPRVKVSNPVPGWQEVEIRVCNMQEMDKPEFWHFLDEAIDGFFARSKRIESNLDDHMPWTKLGRKWHLSRKGFKPGKRVHWEPELIDAFTEQIQKMVPEVEIDWNNKQLVHYKLPGLDSPWISLQTKKTKHLLIHVNGLTESLTAGSVSEIDNLHHYKSNDSIATAQVAINENEQLTKPAFVSLLESTLETWTELNRR
jgi:excinuclease ABC subunit A